MVRACFEFGLPVVALCWVAGAAAWADKAAHPERILIAAGPSVQGSNRGEDDERPQRVVRLPAFRIDRTEVTRGAYARCVAKRRCPSLEGMDGPEPAQADHPVTNVSWSEAQAYCRFVKGRLPTEAQWEKAARGALGRIYPWGDEVDCGRGNWGNFGNEGPCAQHNPGHPVAVGSHPSGATPEGVQDLGGNVWEWVQDAYEADKSRRVVKGGSCCSYFVQPRAANRNAWAPAYRDADLGFRCVYR